MKKSLFYEYIDMDAEIDDIYKSLGIKNKNFPQKNKYELNTKKIIFVSLGFMIFMVFYGIFLPNDWESVFGVFGAPISLVADNIPSVVNLSKASPMPNIIRGFFGMSFWIIILFLIFSVHIKILDLFSDDFFFRLKDGRMSFFSVIIAVVFFLFFIYFCYGMISVDLSRIKTGSPRSLMFEYMAVYKFSLIGYGVFLVSFICFILVLFFSLIMGLVKYFIK